MTDAHKFQAIATSAVKGLTEVRLYDETIEHIKQNHPEVPIELPSILDSVRAAVQRPTHVEQTRPKTIVFVDAESTNASGDPLRVPVRVVNEGSGRVCTAYFAAASSASPVVESKPK